MTDQFLISSSEITMTSKERQLILDSLEYRDGLLITPGVSEKQIIHSELVRRAQEIVLRNPDSQMSPTEYMWEAFEQLKDSALEYQPL